LENYNYIDLFHGIGGFALGAYRANMKFKNHFCSDTNRYCQELYRKRFPGSIQLGDVSKINSKKLLKEYGSNWILTGGFPCQDISIMGKGEGINGKRSGLWFEYWRLIRDLQPQFAILENVGELVRRGLREILGGLVEIGYNAEWQDIRARDVGAPHKRERIWIMAYPASIGLQGVRSTREQKFCQNAKKEKSRSCCDVPFKPLHRWPTEPDMGRMAHGIPRRVDRIKGLGNSIVPDIAKILFETIKPLM